MFCSNCGFENEEGAIFCVECGKRLVNHENTNGIEENSQKYINDEKSRQNENSISIQKKKPRSRKSIFIYSFIFTFGFILVAVYFWGREYYSIDNQVDRYMELLDSGDVSTMTETISTEVSDFNLTEKNLAPFVRFLEEDESYARSLRRELIDSAEADNSTSEVYLSKNGKKFFVFDHYDLMITPIYPTVHAPFVGSVIFLNEQELFQIEESLFSTNIGPIAPGLHTFGVEYEDDGFLFEETIEYQLLMTNSFEDIVLEIENVHIHPSTIERIPLDFGHVNETSYYTDNAGFISSVTTLENGLLHFYNETGIQPHVYTTEDINGETYPTMEQFEEYQQELYDELFTDEAHILLLYFESDEFFDAGNDYYVGVVTGAQARAIMDREALDIFYSYLDQHYYNDTLTYDEFFALTFQDTADQIMIVTQSP